MHVHGHLLTYWFGVVMHLRVLLAHKVCISTNLTICKLLSAIHIRILGDIPQRCNFISELQPRVRNEKVAASDCQIGFLKNSGAVQSHSYLLLLYRQSQNEFI